jgi:serine/threonine protein kinase
MIAHQDVKPSNVLIFPQEGFRLADFGRASVKGREVWYDSKNVAGDFTYAPPELLYGYIHPEFVCRRIGCDLYLLGNLVAFMLAGVNVTGGLSARLDPQFHWQEWHGPYLAVLPYLQDAFGRLLQDLATTIDPAVVADVVPLIKQLCNPDVSFRGHPKAVGRNDQYSLERYVSLFDRLAIKSEIATRAKKKR